MSAFGFVDCGGTLVVPKPWQTRNKQVNRMYYIHSGKGGYIKDGENVQFEKGRLYIIPAFADITTYSDEVDRVNHSYANFEIIPPIISNEVISIDPHDGGLSEAALQLFFELTKNVVILSLDSYQYDMLVSTVIFLTQQALKVTDAVILHDEVIISALKKMHEGIDKRISIDDIATSCYMSTNGFIKRFKKHMKQTPYSYMKKIKLRTAIHMRESGVPLSEVARRCGYSDSSALLHAIANAEKN